MSRLEKLMEEFCPDGVEYKRLGDIAQVTRGGNFQKKDFVEVGVPCIHYGQIYTKYGLFTDKVISYINEEAGRKSKYAEPGDIIMAVTSENVDDVCKSVVWLGNENIAVSGHTAIIHHNQDAKYLAYYFNSTHFYKQKVKLAHGTKVIEVTPDRLKEVQIPVPPLAVQHEIVCTLDQLTESFTELKENLHKELINREKQYAYYRDLLLNFDNLGGVIQHTKLGDITHVFSAARVHRSEWTTSGVPFYRSSDVMSFYKGEENSRGKAFISPELFETLSKRSGRPQKGDILITGGGTIGIPFVVPTDEPLYMKDADLLCIRKSDKLSSRFLYHYFLTTKFRDYLKNITHDATIAHYTISQIENTTVPVPSLEIQDRIVNVLDNFEAICTDLSIGLPAEIEARQKQYEYYRDLLLTFAETGSTLVTDR